MAAADFRQTVFQAAQEAAMLAGSRITSSFGKLTHSDITIKGVNDFVTTVDREAEWLIRKSIASRFPTHRIVAEEHPERPGDADFTWVIDPLDGTANFIHGLPWCAVSLALCDGEGPLFGLVLDPFRSELFHAHRGGGAFLDGGAIHVRTRRDLSGAFGATGFPFKAPSLHEAYSCVFSELLKRAEDMRRCGSAALDLVHTACGRYDFFWEASLHPWDFLAGELIVREAGGRATNFSGEKLALRPDSVLAAPPPLHGELLRKIGPIFSGIPSG